MTLHEEIHHDILDTVSRLKLTGESFALATVVRTVAATAAKAGAKAVIRRDGTILEGWIGGGCARGAVLKAAREALADGKPRLISVQPGDLLEALGVRVGEEREGVRFARNRCPSKGTMDIFIEPVLPEPELIVCGASPVALALADLAPRFGYAVTAAAPAADQSLFEMPSRRIEGYALDTNGDRERYVVVSTQGRGDEEALRAALTANAAYVAFVGSRAKFESLKSELAGEGVGEALFAAVHAPAGLDIGAITPEEIALSILAEIVTERRRGRRSHEKGAK